MPDDQGTDHRIKPATKSVYDQDFYVWTEEQAELLRQRRFEELDLDNLIEEVEGLGDAKKSAVLSNATVVIEHLLKLQLSPAPPPRRLDRFSPRAPQPARVRAHAEAAPDPRGRAAARLRGRPPLRRASAARAWRGRRSRRPARNLPLHGRPDHRRLVAVSADLRGQPSGAT